jgi:alpha-beta hydrolase superfamily lysophospholipase
MIDVVMDVYVVGLIAAIAMSKLPYLVNRAVLLSPMLRLKCALRFFNYHIFVPQPIGR